MRPIDRVASLVSITRPYLIFTSGLIGQDSSRDWGIKWIPSQLTPSIYQEPVLRLISRLVRESQVVPSSGLGYQHPLGLAAVFPHQDHIQRHSYFVVFFPQAYSGQDWQPLAFDPPLQAFLAAVAALNLKQALQALEHSPPATPLPEALALPWPPIDAPSHSVPANPAISPPPTHSPSRFRGTQPKNRLYWLAGLIAVGSLLGGLYWSVVKPTAAVSPTCACYWQWWQRFYDPAQQLWPSWQQQGAITPQHCQAVCGWTGKTLPIQQLLTQMQQPSFWHIQQSVMVQVPGCGEIGPSLYQGLEQCTQLEFGQFLQDIAQHCAPVSCNE